jgi:hypothetical protein
MSGFSSNNNQHLIRANIWTQQTKDVLLDELIGMRYVNMLTDSFPDGDQLNIPSIGLAEVMDYAEGQAIRYTAMDTGNFVLNVTEYKASAVYITNKMKQDTFYMAQLVPQFAPKQERAIMKAIESDVLAIGPSGQTPSNPNTINTGDHRFVCSGTQQTMSPIDFARAKFALQKANMPMTNLVAIVDPSVEFSVSTLTNIANVSNNPQWEGIVNSGMSSGMRFVKNIYGFDVYVSQNLVTGLAETIGTATVANGVANLFFSAANDVLPFVGVLRQPPMVDSGYNKDLQRDEYVTTARWGFKLFRPENIVVGLSNTVTALTV